MSVSTPNAGDSGRGPRRWPRLGALAAGIWLAALIVPAAVSSQPKAVEIAVGKNAFTPREVVVRVGQPVVWRQAEEGRHAIQAADGSFRSPILGAGGSFAFTPTRPGKVIFYCRFHGEPDGREMAGVLDVRPAD